MELTFWIAMLFLPLLKVECSISVPSSLLSPLGVPESMGPAGLTAMKHAVGGRMLTMLGSLSRGPMGTISAGPISSFGSNPLSGFGSSSFSNFGSNPLDSVSQMLSGGLSGGMLPGYPPLTPRSKEFTKRRGPNIPTSFNIRSATPTEVENFFAVLDKVDANKCISRLVCEVGSDPRVLEGLGHNIKDVMTSLRVLERNALSSKYKEIMMTGQKRGLNYCKKFYSECDNKNYRLVRTFIKAFRVKN